MRTLNVCLIIVGIALLGYGHVHWMVRHESDQVKTAVDIMRIVPGWAMLAMGYSGLLCQGRSRA